MDSISENVDNDDFVPIDNIMADDEYSKYTIIYNCYIYNCFFSYVYRYGLKKCHRFV